MSSIVPRVRFLSFRDEEIGIAFVPRPYRELLDPLPVFF